MCWCVCTCECRCLRVVVIVCVCHCYGDKTFTTCIIHYVKMTFDSSMEKSFDFISHRESHLLPNVLFTDLPNLAICLIRPENCGP